MTFYLGGPIAPDGSRIDGELTEYDPSDLTTHGVIIGMTGSGKTGLGIVFLEEALRSGVPALIIDPKGDMTNLLLTFPSLTPEDFRPWIDEGAAAREGRSPDDEAAAEAEKWTSGLASWNLSGADIGDLRERVDMTIYTPGSNAGVALNVVGDLSVPTLSWDSDAETLRDGIGGYVSGLLGLIGVDADPMSSREHILLANLIEHSWRSNVDLTLESLIGQIITPPIRKLGVFEVDTFFPEKDRTALAMRLNGLLASPSFRTWMEGAPLDIEALLWSEGRPRAAVIYLAHLSDSERQFIVTALFSGLITWMRSQPGSSELRALAYMDEVFGFVPPTAEPPAKKPILTMLKQARAFGVGLILSTQNPVDLDYKAMSNAGTWCIGRLQTERDKARVLEAVSAASGDVDVAGIDRQISGLGKRSFVLHNTRDATPQLFTTRWAMSYLRGPMTREEVMSLTAPGERPSPQAATAPEAKGADLPGRSGLPPQVADGIEAAVLHPAAPWAETVGYSADGDRYEAGIAVAVSVRFDDSRLDLDHTETWEAVMPNATGEPGPSDLIEVDHDTRDFLPLDDALPFVAPEGAISQTSYFEKLQRMIHQHLDREGELELFRHRKLDLVSRPGEDLDTFTERVRTAARDAADAEMADKRTAFETRIRKVKRDYEDAVRNADTASAALDASRGDAILGAGLDLLMGRKPRLSGSSARTTENRLRRAEDKVESTRAAYEALGIDLEDALRMIDEKWSNLVSDVEPVVVGLESDDIEVTDVRVVWIRR
ncbi:MAG TPA: DUF87 domain-containing protein [Acidimicrobiia bacterium]|nr:DUF87 domain-containing protein [Acidimicrobiia bacterium]